MCILSNCQISSVDAGKSIGHALAKWAMTEHDTKQFVLEIRLAVGLSGYVPLVRDA